MRSSGICSRGSGCAADRLVSARRRCGRHGTFGPRAGFGLSDDCRMSEPSNDAGHQPASTPSMPWSEPGILVGVDGSEAARTALDYAAQIAPKLGLPLHVLVVWDYPVLIWGDPYSYSQETYESIKADAEQMAADEVGAHLPRRGAGMDHRRGHTGQRSPHADRRLTKRGDAGGGQSRTWRVCGAAPRLGEQRMHLPRSLSRPHRPREVTRAHDAPASFPVPRHSPGALTGVTVMPNEAATPDSRQGSLNGGIGAAGPVLRPGGCRSCRRATDGDLAR